MNGLIQVRAGIVERLGAEAARNPQKECCGLLAGSAGVITEIFPARNALASATAYEISAEELFAIFRAMRSGHVQHLGIYHSHPASENFPSPRDIEQAYYPDVTYFIISPSSSLPQAIRAFSVRAGKASEITIRSIP